jgi:menaquinone-dependent protoporphyrinogen IX oxidase
MRVAVVFFAPHDGSQIGKMAAALAEGIRSQGHEVDLIDGMTEQNKKLIIYQYITIGTEQKSFFGKIHEKIGHFLASQGTVQGKKAFAFVLKKLIGSEKALLRLMSAMEKEGMIVKSSEIFTTPDQPTITGKSLHISI